MLKRVISKLKKSQTTKVGDLMSKPLITASPDMRTGGAAKLMLERNIKKLPIIENRRLVSLVTLTDLLRFPGIVEFLNNISLDGTSKRMKKVINVYYDESKTHRRTCPLSNKDGFSTGCQSIKCMWWAGYECAVTRLSRQISTEEYAETNVTQ